MEKNKRVAVVTGANRGIGLEVAAELSRKGYEVVLTARDEKKAQAALQKITAKFFPLDVTSPHDIDALEKFLLTQYGRIDVLVNNAGIFLDTDDDADASAFKVSAQTVETTFRTNTLGPFMLCQKLIPHMMKSGYGRVVNISSGMGQLGEMDAGYPAYRISKTGINAITRVFSQEAAGKNVLVNSACPGWVKTDMGGPGAERTVAEGADTIVWLATLPEGGPSGGFFRDREPISW